MRKQLIKSPLGKKSHYETTYNPDLLFPISRVEKRKELLLDLDNLPFYGRDLWHGYELSWLNAMGKPVIYTASFDLLCSTPNIIESKSFKLYLNSLNQTRFNNDSDVKDILEKDLSSAAGGSVAVILMTVQEMEQLGFCQTPGVCLDDLDIEIISYSYDPGLLKKAGGYKSEIICSHLFKSNCLVTGQPDWGTLVVEYDGDAINHEAFLRYICSFREHYEFHEQCVERVFTDLINFFQFNNLTVYAQYLRRGGLDINPWRSTQNIQPAQMRFIRQ
ncbi:MAG: NADPH-dependent 7-cyano-7-deazaguanine reductase QueF [Candidatus Endonucleobacter bathymodioli]|uniref:NADPH-dependent 7-cyano-7-deazaguanine reductase n=1 Tax=Candidatus Endonucleibacter bathymodioli TaxID=539814 RepID=A0AA90NSU7_9GAMM|nr:NADPH-dependent 7-cyano-7-deazaguanine reductase QueF [Candidatus Endonucleobacter bathymodioli]